MQNYGKKDVIQNPPDLHKLFVRFSQPKSFNILRIFDEYERLLIAFGSQSHVLPYSHPVLYRIYNLSPSARAVVYLIQHDRSCCKYSI